jgi:hypothetical protein
MNTHFNVNAPKINSEAYFSEIIESQKLSLNGLENVHQQIDKSNVEVESKLKNPTYGSFRVTYEGQKYSFEAMYAFNNYFGNTDLWYTRILKVFNGFDENGKEIDGHTFFGDDKHAVSSLELVDGKLVLNMASSIYTDKDHLSGERLIELELS